MTKRNYEILSYSHTIHHLRNGKTETEIITHEHSQRHAGPGLAHHHTHKEELQMKKERYAVGATAVFSTIEGQDNNSSQGSIPFQHIRSAEQRIYILSSSRTMQEIDVPKRFRTLQNR